jgi:hypothetical protein
VTRVAGREDQRPAHPAPTGRRVEQQPHSAEVDLQFAAGLAVSHRHRRAAGGAAHAKGLQRVAVQSPLRHHHPPPGQQLPGFHRGQALIDNPFLQLIVPGGQRLPRLAPSPGPVRADRLADHRHHRVAELLLTPGPIHTRGERRVDVAVHRLAVRSGQSLYRAEPLTAQPQPENLSDLEHTNLPERHYHLRTAASRPMATKPAAAPQPVDPREVVPLLAEGWSPGRGGTHLKWSHARGGRHVGQPVNDTFKLEARERPQPCVEYESRTTAGRDSPCPFTGHGLAPAA